MRTTVLTSVILTAMVLGSKVLPPDRLETIAGYYAGFGVPAPQWLGYLCKRIDDWPATRRLITNPDMVRYSVPILAFEAFYRMRLLNRKGD
jgi:hypothetical protein